MVADAGEGKARRGKGGGGNIADLTSATRDWRTSSPFVAPPAASPLISRLISPSRGVLGPCAGSMVGPVCLTVRYLANASRCLASISAELGDFLSPPPDFGVKSMWRALSSSCIFLVSARSLACLARIDASMSFASLSAVSRSASSFA